MTNASTGSADNRVSICSFHGRSSFHFPRCPSRLGRGAGVRRGLSGHVPRGPAPAPAGPFRCGLAGGHCGDRAHRSADRGGGSRGGPADHRAAVRVHGGIGPDAVGGLLHRGHATGRRLAAVPPRPAGSTDRRGRRAVGGVFQRHHLPGDDAGRGTPVPAARAQPDPVPDRTGLCGQHRFGRHADWQPAEHADRLGAAAPVQWLPAPCPASGSDQPGTALGMAGLRTRQRARGRRN